MKNLWPQRAFIDLMAGPGRCVVRDTGEEIDGSPLIALRSDPPFTRVVLVEADTTAAKALAARTQADGARCDVVIGDCNAPSTLAEIQRLVSPQMLALCFVDNLGLNVTFDTIRTLVHGHRAIDLLFTFQVNDLTRNVDEAMTSAAAGARFDAFFGTDAWRQVIRDFDGGKTPWPDRATALADFYATQLRTLGHEYVEHLHRVMKNTKKAPLYRLLIASRHVRAIDFFRKIAAIEHDGQRGLFGRHLDPSAS